MKIFKKILAMILLLLLVVATVLVYQNYPKLNILSGYSAKSTASSVFVAGRSLAYTDKTDNNFSPVNLADDTIDTINKIATASVYGLMNRKSIYRKGLGTMLITDDFDISQPYLVPKRLQPDTTTPFPYGNAEPKDTIFENINYENLEKAVDVAFDRRRLTRAFLVIYKDKIIVERYAKSFNKNSRLLGWSMTKSLLSTVYGVAQYQGKLSVEEKAPIKEWQNDARKNITIHNLLQMNSGLDWDENYDEISDATKMLFLEKDMTISQIDEPLVGKPNEKWYYSSGTSNLLSGILRTKLQDYQTYLDYWYTDFIDKIGMNSMILETDMAGNYVASSYSWATARDWAKFGLLYLHKGNWNGTQIFAPSWVDYVTTPTPTSNNTYGAQFWLNKGGKLKDVPKSMYFADGYEGQRVYVLPEQDLVIVRLGLNWFEENKVLKEIVASIQ